ncbi:MAG: helix-turn-helix domain-containing protein [Vicinamibacteria bacterium]
MAAREKVTVAAVSNALIRWRGNVQAAADELGVTRKALYERIARAGIDLPSLRANAKLITPMHTLRRADSNVASVRQTAGAQFPAAKRAPILGVVQQVEIDAPPIKSAPARRVQTRLTPQHQDKLREAKLVLGGRYMIETDENRLLEQFIDECFDPWLADKLSR